MHGMEDHQRPFVWEDSGVTYSSDCLAFEKNMVCLRTRWHPLLFSYALTFSMKVDYFRRRRQMERSRAFLRHD